MIETSRLAVAIGVAASLAATREATAQQPFCATPRQIREVLIQDFHEVPTMIGHAGDGATMTLWVNPASGTWTIVLSSEDGLRSCIVAVGDQARPAPARRPADA